MHMDNEYQLQLPLFWNK